LGRRRRKLRRRARSEELAPGDLFELAAEAPGMGVQYSVAPGIGTVFCWGTFGCRIPGLKIETWGTRLWGTRLPGPYNSTKAVTERRF
jgi:hypothetical protein